VDPKVVLESTCRPFAGALGAGPQLMAAGRVKVERTYLVAIMQVHKMCKQNGHRHVKHIKYI